MSDVITLGCVADAQNMQQITLRLPEDVLEDVEAEAEDAGASRSEYLRDVVESRNEHGEDAKRLREDAERLREEADELRAHVERLRNEKRQILAQREENQELVKYVEQERTLQEERLRASVFTRAKWWVLGRDE